MDFSAAFEQVKHDDMILQSFMHLWQHSADLMFIMAVEENGEFTLYDNNPASRAVCGIAEDADIHRLNLRSIWDDEVVEGLYESYRKAIAARGPITVEQEANDSDGATVYVSTLLVPLFDAQGAPKLICGVSRNITDIKNAEKLAVRAQGELTQSNATLQQINRELDEQVEIRTAELKASKLKAEEATRAKSDFLAKMSHEIRTPMNAVIGLTRLALQTDVDRRQKDYLDKVLDAAEGLLVLINDILDFSKIEAGKFTIEQKPFRLEHVVGKAVSLCAMNIYNKGLELVTDIAAEIPAQLQGDELRIRQILVNLLNNAAKFTDEGGVCLKIRVGEETPQRIRLLCSVIDTGIGLSREQQEKIFGSFTQADESVTRKYGGTGLGLTISRQLCELMGGEIWLESELGKGTRFHFTLQLDKVPTQAAEQKREDGTLAGLNVLVVDDSDMARNVLVRMLHDCGIKTAEAKNGADAVAIVNREQQDGVLFDLVLLDGCMPGMNGIETAVMIHQAQQEKTPQILMASAYDRDEVLGRLDKQIVGHVLEKPVSSSALLDVLKQAVTGVESAEAYSTGRYSEAAERASAPDLSASRILLVDDGPINRQIALGFLRDTGAIVETANNGLLALDKLAQTDYDLVLMDIQMPEMDGLTAVRRIRTRLGKSELPVIAMTAQAMAEDVDTSLQAGMNEHLTKPIVPETLYRVLAKYLPEQQRPIRGEAAPEELVDEEMSTSTGPVRTLEQLETVAGIDSVVGIGNLGNEELYLPVVNAFIEKYQGFAEKCNAWFEASDWQMLQCESHSLKSNAAYIGAPELSVLGENLEKKFASGVIDRDLVFEVCRKLSDLLAQFDLSEKKEQPVASPVFSSERLASALAAILPLLERSDFAVEELLPPLQRLCANTPYAEAVERIVADVNELEYERAAIFAAGLLDKLSPAEK